MSRVVPEHLMHHPGSATAYQVVKVLLILQTLINNEIIVKQPTAIPGVEEDCLV